MFELRALYKDCGVWVAVLYNRLCGYDKVLRFFDYTKKETIHLLRHNHGIKVSHSFY